jgi:TRAP-type C4-dicarboxylate transport system substrate-binding protein
MFSTLKLGGGVVAGILALTASCWAQTTLSLSDQNSPNSLYEMNGIQPWVKKVEEATKGKVKIRTYFSKTLVKGNEMWKGTQSGITDIGWMFHGYWPELTPLSDVITLPLLPFTTAAEGSAVLNKLIAKFPVLQKEYAAVKELMYWTSNQYVIISTKKNFKTMDDFKGMKLRAAGGPPSDQIRALGGVAMLIPMPDIYQALEKGVIDGAVVPWEGVHGFRLYEVAKYYTIAPMSAVYFSMAMNKETWGTLPKDVQDQIMSVSGPEGSVAMGTNVFDEAEAVVMGLVKQGNYTAERYVLPPEEVARWRKVAGEPIWQDWVKKMESKGKPEAKEILAATLELLKK